MSAASSSLEQLAINTIRTLSMDGVEQANSGHPGTPMALAPVAYALWNGVLRFDPADPLWPARDRFVLSCGHASMLLYSLLHMAGVRGVDKAGRVLDTPSVSLDDLRNFRQLHSPCAGHPEFGEAAGIEMTTGPLGQGAATSIGMAMASKWLAARYDRPGFDLFGYHVYALCSDGDLMEGVASEAASLAGHLRLGNLCWIYDDNSITIEGKTDLAFSENVSKKFEGLGWNTVTVSDANDVPALTRAMNQFAAGSDRPTLIIVKSIIAFGSPNKANTSGAHGSPLGEKEVRLTKEALGWPADEKFLVPAEAREQFAAGIGQRGEQLRTEWRKRFAEYQQQHPQAAAELQAIWTGQLPGGWEQTVPQFAADAKGKATRATSGEVLNRLGAGIPWLVGGSADLAPSNLTLIQPQTDGHFQAGQYAGRNFHFGIREHAMAAVCNGMALSGLRPYCGTFFVFTDYMRPAMRLAALMRQGVIYVLTHDSIGLGEDGPTHQPVEHLAACRAIPRLLVFRPADANEVAESYRAALLHPHQPSAMVLTRQNVPTLDRASVGSAAGVARGGYVLRDAQGGAPQVILIGTGSEIGLCLAAQEKFATDGVRARVVSMPCFELFDAQDAAYRESVLPSTVTARVGVEAGIVQGWEKYLGCFGRFVGMSDFGASGPFEELYTHFGITAEGVVSAAQAAMAKAAC
jgi:transketolase